MLILKFCSFMWQRYNIISLSWGFSYLLVCIVFSLHLLQVIATSVSRKVSIVDVERGTPVLAYDNCVSPGEGRQPLVMHPDLPYLAACITVNARGITLLDLRMPLPLDFIYDVSCCSRCIVISPSLPRVCKSVWPQ